MADYYKMVSGVTEEYFNNLREARDAAIAAFHATGNVSEVFFADLSHLPNPIYSIHEGNTVRENG